MRSLFSLFLILTITSTGCGEKPAETNAPAAAPVSKEVAATAAEPQPEDATANLDIRGSDAAELCARLVPEDLHALGVSDRWSKDRKLVARKLYADSRISCAWEGFDPDFPVSRATTFFKIEVECGKKDPQELCSDKLSAPRPPGMEPYPETVEGALCHTLSKAGGNNWVILDNGCFIILYDAKPEIIGIPAEEKERRWRETKLAAAREIVARIR